MTVTVFDKINTKIMYYNIIASLSSDTFVSDSFFLLQKYVLLIYKQTHSANKKPRFGDYYNFNVVLIRYLSDKDICLYR